MLIISRPFTRPVSDADDGPDPYFSSVQALLHMDDASWTDVKGHVFSLQGGNVYSTAQKKFGTGSMFANNSTNSFLQSVVSQDFNVSGDFTSEMWFYSNNFNLGGTQTELMGFYPTVATGWTSNYYSVYLWGTNGTITSWAASPSNDPTPTNHGMVAGNWYHIAVSKSGSTVRVFINGNLIIASEIPNIPNQPMCMRIGSGTLNGNIDEVRFTKGVARYTAPFTPPTKSFSNTGV